MKRIILAAAIAVALALPAHAAEVSLKLDDGAQSALSQLSAAMDACVASMTLRNDPATCKQVSSVLAALGNEVKMAQAKAAAEAKAAEEAKAKKDTKETKGKKPEVPTAPTP